MSHQNQTALETIVAEPIILQISKWSHRDEMTHAVSLLENGRAGAGSKAVDFWGPA